MERLAGRVILLSGWRRAVCAAFAGAVAALTQAPFDFFAAGFIAFPLLVWLIDGAAPPPGAGLVRRLFCAFPVGWWFGLGYFCAGLWWVGNALLVEAELFAWALPLAIFGLPALLAVFYAFATMLARLFWSEGLGRIAALAFAFGIAEFLRGFLLTGFPWNAIGLAAMPVPVAMQSLRVVGMDGMNTLAVFVFAMPALLSGSRGRLVGAALVVALAAAHLGYGALRLDRSPVSDALIQVRIVQPSIEQDRKWDGSVRDRIFADYLELSGRPPETAEDAPQLIVWPETAVPFFLTDRPDALVALGELVGDGQTLLAGAVRTEGEAADQRYYNAVLSIDGSGEIVDAVDKLHLVPFGEYLPFGGTLSRLGLRQLAQSVGGFSAGSQRKPLQIAQGVAALPFICYEIIFPGAAGYGGADAQMLVNVTNDAWFGITPGPYQHFRQAQLRAVEAGRPLVRAANNGISGVVDAYGRVVDAFDLDAVGVLDTDVPSAIQVPSGPLTPRHRGLLIIAAMTLLAGACRLGTRRDAN